MDALLDRLSTARRPLVLAIHLFLFGGAYLLAFLLRFDFLLSPENQQLFLATLPLLLLARVPTFAWFHLYEGLWRYVSMRDIVTIMKAVTLSSLVFVAAVLVVFGHGFPRSVLVLEWVLCLALVGGVRLGLRAFREARRIPKSVHGRRVLIVGAGDAGERLIREIERDRSCGNEVVGFVDDNPTKHGKRIHGVPVIGAIEDLPEVCRAHAVEEVLIATPSAPAEDRRRILECCRKSGVAFRTVPPLNELLEGRARIAQLSDVTPEDVLGRRPIQLDVDVLHRQIGGRCVLVTGAAGSIGAELSRQVAVFKPEVLVLLDRAESGLYFIEGELTRKHPAVRVVPIVGDILNRAQMEDVIGTYAPEIVYHAAAYKHVPLMEAQPLEAITNNVFGTETMALAARQARVKRFVFISTDKAVRPVSVMGMTKRVAERLLQAFDRAPTLFVAVRFGNVLGSDGSVLPLFQRQIAGGAPLTVTDPDACRYFMLLSEAAQLVLQAGAIGQGADLFFLDMGEPVRIIDLAHNLVRLSGFKPGRDVEIEVTGLRPGERLSEALVMEGEELQSTGHDHVSRVTSVFGSREEFERDLEELRRVTASRDRPRALAQLQAMATREY